MRRHDPCVGDVLLPQLSEQVPEPREYHVGKHLHCALRSFPEASPERTRHGRRQRLRELFRNLRLLHGRRLVVLGELALNGEDVLQILLFVLFLGVEVRLVVLFLRLQLVEILGDSGVDRAALPSR